MEIWKDTEYENYEVSNLGQVRNKKTGYILKPAIQPKGYHKAQIQVNGKLKGRFIHRLVAIAFIPNPNNLPQVDHLDNDKSNNHVSNLEWVTGQENHRRKVADGLNIVPEHAGRQKQPVKAFKKDGTFVGEFPYITKAAEELGLQQAKISAVLNGIQTHTKGYKFERI